MLVLICMDNLFNHFTSVDRNYGQVYCTM